MGILTMEMPPSTRKQSMNMQTVTGDLMEKSDRFMAAPHSQADGWSPASGSGFAAAAVWSATVTRRSTAS